MPARTLTGLHLVHQPAVLCLGLKTSYANGQNIVCHRSKHCMVPAKSLYANRNKAACLHSTAASIPRSPSGESAGAAFHIVATIAKFALDEQTGSAMRIKTVIDDTHTGNKDLVAAIVQGQVEAAQTFCDQRNVVYLVRSGDAEWVVKRFKRPTLINRFAYTFLRPSKAKRAYLYSYRYLASGIDTARSVAYAEVYRGGLFHTGYYISEYTPLPDLTQVYGLDEGERRKLFRDFAAFTARMHEAGIIDMDYNVRNVLWRRMEDGHYHFTLVDINRTKFRSPRPKDCARALTTSVALDEFIDEYCRIRRIDRERFDKLLRAGSRRIERRIAMHKRRHWLKQHFQKMFRSRRHSSTKDETKT